MTTQTDRLMALHDAAVAAAIQVAVANLGDRDNAARAALLAALQEQAPNWSDIGRLIEAANGAAARGFISGTSNWAAFVSQAMECCPTWYATELRREGWDAALQSAQPVATTVPDNSQDWKGMDGTTAFHLITRHADGWADVGKMMGEWLDANQAAQPVAQPLPDTKKLFSEWYDSLPYGEPSYQETFEAGVKAGIGSAL